MTRHAKHWTRIEAKKTFAGLTRARRPLSKPAMIAAMDGIIQAASMPPEGGQPAYAISRAIAALKRAIGECDPPKGCIHHSDRGSQ
jgi:hypothetical protein